MRSSWVVKARSDELSLLEVSASPRIVRHAKTYHLRGSSDFTKCPLWFSKFNYRSAHRVPWLASLPEIGMNWKREHRTRVPSCRGLPSAITNGSLSMLGVNGMF